MLTNKGSSAAEIKHWEGQRNIRWGNETLDGPMGPNLYCHNVHPYKYWVGHGRAHPAHWVPALQPWHLAPQLKLGSPTKLVPLTFLPYLYALMNSWQHSHGTYICTCDLNAFMTVSLASLCSCKAWCLYMCLQNLAPPYAHTAWQLYYMLLGPIQ